MAERMRNKYLKNGWQIYGKAMQMDFEKLIREATGLRTADTVFTKPQKLPFVIFIDKQTTDGDDFHTQVIEHNLTVEFYAERIDKEHEEKLEALFEKQGWKWTRDRQWLPKPDCCFETVYTINNFLEHRKDGTT